MTRVHWIDPSWETSWGIGYAVSKGHKNSVVVGHGGACPGYSTQFSTVPKTGLAVIVMVNSPEVAILGVSRAQMAPVWTGEDFAPRLLLPLSLSYDHRVIDGAAAARFVTDLGAVLGDLRRLLL